MAGRVSLAVLTSRGTGSHVLGALAALRDHVTVGWILGSDVASAETQAEQHGFVTSQVGKAREWDTVCKDGSVDAMLVCSPDASVNMVRRALCSGKSVFCDRPVSLQPSAMVACYEEAAAHNAHLLFGFLGRHDPVMAEVRNQLKTGLVGDVQSVKMSVTYPPDTESHTPTDSGRLFRECISRHVDTACWLLGASPLSVYAGRAAPRTGESSSLNVVLKYDKAIATLVINTSQQGEKEDNQLEIHGSKGEVLLTDGEQSESSSISSRQLVIGKGSWQSLLRPGMVPRSEAALSITLAHLIGAVRGEVATTDDNTNSLNTICVTAACQHALQSNQAVTMATQDTELPEVNLKVPLWKERPAAWF